MPKISIIVAAYNVEAYLADCLASISAQTFPDFEAIVVDDASTDATAQILEAAADKDPRIVAVTHESNQGLHLVRKTGVEHASGDYAFFLDGDDAIAPDFCKELASEIAGHPADILHFGLDVVGSNGILESECQAFEAFNNAPTDDAAGEDILRNIFDPERGQQVDWRVTQRLMRTELLKSAFGAMTGERLERAEDGYECFVISALASSYRSFKQCRGYIYHYGRGVTGTNEISSSTYARFCAQFKACLDAAGDFTQQHGLAWTRESLLGFEHKAIELLANDWNVRVPDAEKPAAAKAMAEVFGPEITAREIYRFVRDRAYEFLEQKNVPNEGDRLFTALAVARSFTDLDPQSSAFPRYLWMKDKAENHMTQLQPAYNRIEAHRSQSTRIFVTSHKRADMPASDILQMVQVGPGNTTDRFLDAFHDDTGDNISAKNPMYCELTTQYWAWKNAKADYYGFCHYRRYFDFSDVEHEENPYGEIMDDYIDAEATAKYGLDDDAIAKSIAGYDVVTTGIKDLRGIINGLGTPKAVWAAAPYLLNRDLRHVYDILCAMHPDYAKDANDFLDGHYSCFCNMFIMKKDIFFDYCAWLFPILEEFERTTDMSRYSKEALRTPGHLSERLLNIYLMHHKRIGSGWKTKELQCVHFTNPEPEHVLEPLQGVKDPSTIIPVVFAADNNYVPMLTTTIYSAMKNADPKRRYDVTVLQKDIDGQNQQTMREFFSRFSNMNLRFVNVDRKIAGYDLSTNNQHISNETYYRFLIQEILPFYSKVLYLDSDIIVTGDIAALYDTELGDNLLAACRDIDYLGNLNIKIDNKRIAYSKDILGMRNPYDYFQAGVLVLNTAAMRSHYSIGQWLEYASNPDFIYNDQDVLNVHCEGKVTFLDWNWDVIHDCDGRVAKVFSFAPNDIYDAYMRSRQDPKIIHYAGFIKPWVDPACDFASVYWDYARDTPFYERLIKRVAESIVPNAMRLKVKKHQPALNDSNPLRRVIDPIAPLGSKRREAMKAAGRLVRGRK
jgi:lipopolysaccharide biosynthesis glycosyltransferase/glycosyltransferase involved in cell wall biosynthesis